MRDLDDYNDYAGRDMDDPDIGEWDYLPGEVWRPTEFLAAASIRGDWATLSEYNFPLSDDMIERMLPRAQPEHPEQRKHPQIIQPLERLRCLRCEEWKPLREFGKDTRKLSGRKSWCKACCREAERVRWHRTKKAAHPKSKNRATPRHKRDE